MSTGTMGTRPLGIAAAALGLADLSTAAFAFLSAFFFRTAGMQIQALKRARWGADHDISGYSGGESIFTRFFPSRSAEDDLKISINRERSIRMFLEPFIYLST
jgi:hypothetical protein